MNERPPLPHSFRDIRERLQANVPRLLDALNLHGRSDGARVYPLNPTRNDRSPGSFVIWTRGEAPGSWRDYACGDEDKGDVIDLIAYVLRLRTSMDAYWWALDFLGLNTGQVAVRTKEQAQQDRERQARDQAAAAARAEAEDEAKSAALFALWLKLPGIAGTPAERYLREARGIPLERLAHMPGALRWAEEIEFIDGVGEVHTWRHVMVSAMTKGAKLVALHRTYLKPDGSGKADMAKPKLMLGPVKGSAIRLTPGASKLSPSKAEAAGKLGPLAIGEGIETCLTVACARPDYRVWAAGSLSLMALIEWPACANAVVLLRDNDWKAEARAAFDRAETWWRDQARGRPVVVAASAVGSDFNDQARAVA